MLVAKMLSHLVRVGTLSVIDGAGRTHRLGSGEPPSVTVRLHDRALYDERFCRMWEVYLASAEVAFRYLGYVVLQIQLAKRQDAVPLTRDYVTEFERALAKTAGGRPRRAA